MSTKTPVNVPWPANWQPKPVRITPSPASSAPLPKADALVVTWTSGEARTMGQLFADQPLASWHEYKHNVADFIPKVTGSKAPFNDAGRENARYYQSLGLYCLVDVGGISVLVLKSGLHPAYDGPDVPMVDLWQQMITEVQPKLVITTGTGGGIGADVQLGDVVIAANVLFDATAQFKDESWAHASYACSALQETTMKALITEDLLQPNGQRLMTPRLPVMIYPSTPGANVVTTDTFAFDDSTDYYKLQGLGKCCDMGDAVLGLALSNWTPPEALSWVSIRNASDPQINDPSGNIQKASKTAESIYETYQEITTAGSVVATWATIIAQLS
jgi:nucleoside phosphorylase